MITERHNIAIIPTRNGEVSIRRNVVYRSREDKAFRGTGFSSLDAAQSRVQEQKLKLTQPRKPGVRR